MQLIELESTVTFDIARESDCSAIVGLINSAYRGEASRLGWTTEADLIDGQRTDENEVFCLIRGPDSVFLVCRQGVDLIGCILLKEQEDCIYLGMFAIRPDLQGRGTGRHLLQMAEIVAQQRWGKTRLCMTVITVREQLVAFYQRRGYRRTGETKPFSAVCHGRPRFALRLEILEKNLGETRGPTCAAMPVSTL